MANTNETDNLIPDVAYEVSRCPLDGRSDDHSHSWDEWGFPDNNEGEE